MNQEIKIPVSANTDAAERDVADLEQAFDRVAGAVGGIDDASKKAARGLSDLLRRARDARQMLSRELRSDISAADTTTFMRNFAGMQPRSASLRGFNTEADWFSGHRTLFKDDRRAAEHRRRVFTYGMQGTAFARRNPPVEPDDGIPGGGGGGGGSGGGRRSEFDRGLARSGGMAMGFGRSMLALAGVGSVMAMAGKAIDLATEEATGTDTLKRRMGDLDIAYTKLRRETRASGDGLGVGFVEANRLTQAYAREVGNLGRSDLSSLGSVMHGQFGFARAYGADPATSTQFFGQMARHGIGRDESSQRRLAMLIGDAVAKSGYGGKVEDLMQSIADYTATASRMTLTVANTGAYANALTSLTSRGLPGLDPAGAAALLSTADSNIRRGGAMGEASLNFSYAALRNGNPGMNPAQAMALMEGGLFGTTRGVFGGGSPLSKFMGKGIKLDDTTNIDKMIPLLRRSYGNGAWFLNALKNHTGVSSHAQAAVLADMHDHGELGATSSVLDSAGIDPMRLSADGLQMVGTLANAKGSKLTEAFDAIVNRSDVTAAQKRKLRGAAEGARAGGEDAMRRAMVAAVAELGLAQEKTAGTETRDAVVELTNKLTEAGGPLLSVLNPIREAVVAIAEKISPGYMDLSGTDPVEYHQADPKAVARGMADPANAGFESSAMKQLMGYGWKRHQAAAIVGRAFVESSYKSTASNNIAGGHRGLFQWDRARWKQYQRFAQSQGFTNLQDPAAQIAFADWELRNTEHAWGEMLGASKDETGASKAMIGFERPEGYDPIHLERGRGYNVGLSVARRLASDEKAPASSPGSAPGAQHHVVEVHVRDNQGVLKSHQVKIPVLPTSMYPPSASGTRTTTTVRHAGGAPR